MARFNKTVLVLLLLSFFHLVRAVQIIDLTYSLDAGGITWPLNRRFDLTIVSRGPYKVGDITLLNWVESNNLAFNEHTGTHMDAPAHFGNGRLRIDDIPIERLQGPGVVINVKDKAFNNPNFRVNVAELKNWERKHGRIPDNAFVFIYTGWGTKYPDEKVVWGTRNLSDYTSYNFPSWHEEGVRWMVNERSISCIGVDVPSLDYGQTRNFPVHNIIAANNILGIENTAYLEKLPETGSMVYASVMKVKDGSGAPVRLFAVVGSSGKALQATVFSIICAFIGLI